MQVLKTLPSQLPKAQAVQLSQSPCDCKSAQLLLKWALPGYLQHTYCSHRLSLSSPAVPPAWTPGALLQLLLLPSNLLVITSSWQWDKAISEDAASLWIWRTWYPFWGIRRWLISPLCQFHFSAWAQSQPCSRLLHTPLLRPSSLLSMNRSFNCRTARLRKGESNARLCCLMQSTELYAPIYSIEAMKICHKLHPTSCCFSLEIVGLHLGTAVDFPTEKTLTTPDRTPQLLVAFPTAWRKSRRCECQLGSTGEGGAKATRSSSSQTTSDVKLPPVLTDKWKAQAVLQELRGCLYWSANDPSNSTSHLKELPVSNA